MSCLPTLIDLSWVERVPFVNWTQETSISMDAFGLRFGNTPSAAGLEISNLVFLVGVCGHQLHWKVSDLASCNTIIVQSKHGNKPINQQEITSRNGLLIPHSSKKPQDLCWIPILWLERVVSSPTSMYLWRKDSFRQGLGWMDGEWAKSKQNYEQRKVFLTANHWLIQCY